MTRYRVVERSQFLPARLVVIDEYGQRHTFDTWSGNLHNSYANPYLEFYSDYGVWYPVADQRWYTTDELLHWQQS
jgi:hypothetical protein